MGIIYFPSGEYDWGLGRPKGWVSTTTVNYRVGKAKAVRREFEFDGTYWLLAVDLNIDFLLHPENLLVEFIADRRELVLTYDLDGLAETIKLSGVK